METSANTGDSATGSRAVFGRHHRRANRVKYGPLLVALALGACAIAGIRGLRESVLRAAGWALVVNGPVAPADVIVLTLDSGNAGALEAAELVHRGIARRVAVFADPPTPADRELKRQGLPYGNASAWQISQLRSLGVTDIVQISQVDGTEGEGQTLPSWCDKLRLQSIVVVVTKDHSRRLSRVLDRAMHGHPTRVMIQPARYSSFDPDLWWKTRLGTRIEIVELEKLLLDVMLHPVSF